MPRGSPDYGLPEYGFATVNMDTLGLAAMLYGFASVDGKGRPIYFDHFATGLGGFGLTASGGAEVPYIVTEYDVQNGSIFIPPRACQLRVDKLTVSSSYISRSHFLGETVRIGLEAGFTFFENMPEYRLTIDYKPIGHPSRYGSLVYDYALEAWRVRDPGGLNTIYEMAVPSAGNYINIQVKFVADWSTGKYVRAMIGDHLIDISAYDLASTGITSDGMIVSNVIGARYDGSTEYGLCGYYLFTRDEP